MNQRVLGFLVLIVGGFGSWLINGRGIAKKVKNPTTSFACHIKDCGASRECPNCHFHISNSDIASEWPGLPIGVKFEPSDEELLVHLEAKCGVGNKEPHMLIEEFIPTLEGEGIYCDHPENLPGAKKDGSSIHFFHKTVNAYATGKRKRRKVNNEHSSSAEHVRWHKTGTTKAVIDNGVQKGFKKIMVLYKGSKKGLKPGKTNWAMHQYHLGTEEDEKAGEYVVSKIFYQQQKKQTDVSIVIEESDTNPLQTSPKTPNPNPPIPPRHGKSIMCDDIAENTMLLPCAKGEELVCGESHDPQTGVQDEDDAGYPTWLAGESQAAENPDLNCIDDTLLCKESFDPGFNNMSDTNFTHNDNNIQPCGISELANLEMDTPPDFQLSDLQFGSQDSIFDWLDKL
ncbi:hypothetical protein UlMin_022395 [Ulmus minor]